MDLILAFTAVTPEQLHKDFCCLVEDIEEAWDFLQNIRKRGDTFLKADMVHPYGCYHMPLDLINQNISLNPFAELRHQWETCFAQTLITTQLPKGNVEKLKRIHLHQSTIAQLEESVHQMFTLLESTQENLPDSPHKLKLIQRHTSSINYFNRWLTYHNRALEQILAGKTEY